MPLHPWDKPARINPSYLFKRCTFECTALSGAVHFFLPFSRKFVPKKFHFIVFFIVIYLSHLMHRVSQVFIISDSEYTPDLLSARGVTAGSRRFFVLQGKFFAKKSGPESARSARDSTIDTLTARQQRRKLPRFAPPAPSVPARGLMWILAHFVRTLDIQSRKLNPSNGSTAGG